MTTMTDSTRRVTGGVDTHKDAHVAAVLDEVGRVLGTEEFPATPAGYRRLLQWMRVFGDVVAVGVEGTGSWGAGLSRRLTAEGVAVIEVTLSEPAASTPSRQVRPGRRHRSGPGRGAGEATGTPKSELGAVEAIRLLRVARRSAVKARTQAANQLHAVVDTAPAELRERLGSVNTEQLIAMAARFHRCHPSPPQPLPPGSPCAPSLAAGRPSTMRSTTL